ncbi:MAG: M20/M25/M40 family metallo-hydrolase [Candidatus Bathyarchaeia archaeon]
MSPAEKRAVDFLIELLRAYSPFGQEGAASDLILSEMTRLGIRARRDEVGNVIGEVGSGAHPALLLCGHMDTVPGFIPVRVEGGTLYGRGAVDAKSSLASMILSAGALAKEGINGRIIMACVVDEEGEGRGIKNLMKGGLDIDYAIFGEPSGVSNITIGYKGSMRIILRIGTEPGHSSAPWLFENAIERAFELWGAFKEFHLPGEDLSSKFYSITSCIMKIRGGSDSTSVPSECDLTIDLRFPPQISLEAIFSKARELVDKFREEHPKVSVDLEFGDITKPFEADRRSPLVRALSWAIRTELRKQPTLLRKTGTADLNVLGEALKVPMVAYGPGDSRLDHTPHERIDIREYLDSIRVYKAAIRRLFELHRAGPEEGIP